jgi:predicted acetyltransferase
VQVSLLIKKGGKYDEFIHVNKNNSDHDHFAIVKFSILKNYRMEGIGKAAERQLFTWHKGDW